MNVVLKIKLLNERVNFLSWNLQQKYNLFGHVK